MDGGTPSHHPCLPAPTPPPTAHFPHTLSSVRAPACACEGFPLATDRKSAPASPPPQPARPPHPPPTCPHPPPRPPPYLSFILSPLTTTFLGRLRANDQAAWFELWRTFGPIVQAQLAKWGRGRIGTQTVQDLSQDTLASLAESIDRFDPARGVRFSTWLLAIAKHVLGDELDKRRALKRGGDKAALSLEEEWMIAAKELPVDEQYEAAIFRAKVEAALASVAQRADFGDFQVYRLRVLEGQSGKDVAQALGVSEPTISRRAARVRDMLRETLIDVIGRYSFTPEESDEPRRAGLDLARASGPQAVASDPQVDAAFDAAIAEIYHTQALARQRLGQQLAGK